VEAKIKPDKQYMQREENKNMQITHKKPTTASQFAPKSMAFNLKYPIIAISHKAN